MKYFYNRFFDFLGVTILALISISTVNAQQATDNSAMGPPAVTPINPTTPTAPPVLPTPGPNQVVPSGFPERPDQLVPGPGPIPTPEALTTPTGTPSIPPAAITPPTVSTEQPGILGSGLSGQATQDLLNNPNLTAPIETVQPDTFGIETDVPDTQTSFSEPGNAPGFNGNTSPGAVGNTFGTGGRPFVVRTP